MTKVPSIIGKLKSMVTEVMKRWRYLLIAGLFVVMGIFWNLNTQIKNEARTNLAKQKPLNRLTTYVPRKFPSRQPVVKSNRSPASIVKKIRPQVPNGIALGKNPIQIGKSFKVVDSVATLEKEKYKKSMGKKIFENDKYVFFKPISTKTEAWPVALNSTNLRLYPISHVLHIKDVNADLRAQFKAEGMQEFYYNSRLEFLFVEASPSTVLQQFHKLTARGFDVRLEVIKETPKAN